MAVTQKDVAADSRAQTLLSELHRLIEAPAEAEAKHLDDEIIAAAAANRSWLDVATELAARNNPAGTSVTLPVGSPYVRVVVIVPDDVAP